MSKIQITELDNGIRVISENIPYVRSFSLGFWFNTGSRDETPENNGISHFLEHMFFKGTQKRTARRIADEIESSGGYLNAFTSKEHTCFYGRGLSQYLTKTFSVLSDMIQFSLFKESEIRKEAGVVIDELKDIEDTPEDLIFDIFESAAFKNDSLGLPIIGTEDNIRGFSRKDLIEYVEKNYGFDNLYIVASGMVDHKKLISLTEKYMSKDLGAINRRREPVTVSGFESESVSKEIQQAHLIMGRPTYGMNDDRRIQASILSHILGEGSYSRLFNTVREKNGIAYQVNSFLNSFEDVSTFGIYLSTNEKALEKAIGLINNEFAKLRSKKVSQKELLRAKEYLKGSIVMSLESTENRMLRIAQSMLYYNRIKPLEETITEIDKITLDDILHISNELLNEKEMAKVIISSGDKNLIHSAA